jgi:hypothetical protein
VQMDERATDARVAERASESAENAALRATRRRQAGVIETLTRVVGHLRIGVSALKAENAELRAALERREDPGFGPQGVTASKPSEWAEARVLLDAHAATGARDLVAQLLAGRVPSSVLEGAKSVMSELVARVRHGDVSRGGRAAIRVAAVDGGIWLEVEDPGRGEVVAQRAADARARDGFDPRGVHSLSERWGSERCTNGGTRIWAQLSGTAASLGPDVGESDEPRPAGADAAGGDERHRRDRGRAAVAERSREVHVVPQSRAATWGVYVDAVAGALSEHTSETAAESAARAHALMRGAGRIVIHDRYHRTRLGAPTPRVTS